MGKWNYEAMNKSYLMYFKPVGLLAAAGWPGAANNDYEQFWHPRFCVSVPQELVDLLFPFLQSLKQVMMISALHLLFTPAPLAMWLWLR